MARVIDAIIQLKDQFTPTLQRVNNQLQEHSKQHQRLGKDIEKTGNVVSGFSKNMAMLSAPLIGAATAGLKLNADFSDGLAKVSTALDTSVIDMQKVRKELIDISNSTGISVTDLTNAEYQCLSAGVAAEKSTDFLSKAMITAKAGFADGSTAINSLTTVLNAYGMEAEKVTNISDQMLTAQNFGKTTFAEMGQSLGNVIPIAASLNVKTEELFASIATLTRNGVQTSEAITGLKAAYSNILKPSAEAGKLAESLGLEFNSAHLKSVGWAKFLEEIKEKTGGNEAQMAKLFGSVEALNTVMVLAGKGSKDFATALDLMNKSGGATEEAYNKLLTPAEQNRIAMNQLKNAGMELSQGLTPILRATTIVMKQFATALNSMTPEQKELLMNIAKFIIVTAIMTGVVGKTVSVVGGAVTKFGVLSESIKKAGGSTAFLKNKLGWIVTGFKMGANGASFMSSYIVKAFRVISVAARAMFLSPIGIAISVIIVLIWLLVRNWDMIKNSLMGTYQQITNGTKQFLGGIIQFVTGVFTGNWQMAWEGVKNIFAGAFNALAGIAKAPLNTVIALINAVINRINGISFTAPSWVPGVGGQTFQANLPTVPMLAKGAEYWHGGPAMVHDAGAEIIDLPRGSRVYPHDKSLEMAKAEGAKSSGGNITIAKIADSIIVREEADIQRIAQALAMELKKASINMA